MTEDPDRIMGDALVTNGPALIPDPAEPHRQAIDADTGAIAHGVFFAPADHFSDPQAPTAAELNAAMRAEFHIGYLKRQGDA